MIQLNPIVQAEIELMGALPAAGLTAEQVKALHPVLLEIMNRAMQGELLLRDAHPQCGADNPKGTAALCKCHCHQGHYRHHWESLIKTPVRDPSGTFHLLERCKYCPDIKLNVIKTGWKEEKHELMSAEYIIRGEQKVLTKEEYYLKAPTKYEPKFMREKSV